MNPDFSKVAKMFSIESVADILTYMMDNKFHTVNELAKIAKIKQNTASYHLKKMYELNWLEIEKQSRHVYYRLASKEIADIVEQMMSTSQTKELKSTKESVEQNQLFNARTCYDHLAGKFGVYLTDWFITKGYIVHVKKDVYLTKEGEQFFQEKILIDLEMLKSKKRKFAVMCLDWSERRYHLAGSLGNAILLYLKENQLITLSNNSRSVNLTDKGKVELIEKWNALDLVEKYENSIYR